MYAFDTNVYLDAAERASFAEQMATFVEQSDQPFAVSSIVIAELLVGLTSEAERAPMLARVYSAVSSRLVLTPRHEDWERAADALRRLGGSVATPRRSFWNDLLLAATCARTDCTLVTSNRDNFHRIAKHIPLRFVTPWQ